MSDSNTFLPEDPALDQDDESREPARYVVGVDLGTTNSALAYIDTRERWTGDPPVHSFEVPQLVAEGAVAPRATLPSFLYLPGPHELPHGTMVLPWDQERGYAVGEFARVQGARVPAHLVSSAKSWLCHGDVDRTADILPWGGESEDVTKLSPVEVSARYLQHMREAWNDVMAKDDAALRLELQDVVLTVPASFDEVARELTLAAARSAGFERVHLLEEPQAAFYAWLAEHASTWSETLAAGQVILVCDIGGGTTDFSLIVVREGRNGLRFERVAVGEHLMLGGDNMDLALARLIEDRLTEGGAKLDSQALAGLIHACRGAKEELLGQGEGAHVAASSGDRHPAGWPSAVPVADDRKVTVGVASGGAKLVGGFLRSDLTADEAHEIVVDGFFPRSQAADEPTRARTGLREWGLPYVADAAVTKHLASFLRRHRASVGDSAHGASVGLARPDLILWNGAALTPSVMRERLVDVISGWFVGEDASYVPHVLENRDLRLAVARGAAYYGIVRRGRGVRIHGGSARGYYIGVEHAGQAGGEAIADPVGAVCLVRRGTEEGETIELDRGFEAHVNRPVSFTLYSSSVRTDQNGELIVVPRDELVELPEIRTMLRFGKKSGERQLPVAIGAHLTEVGTLDLFCASTETEHRWRLRFQVRHDPGDPRRASGATIDQGVTLEEALVEELERMVCAAFEPSNVAEAAQPAAADAVTPQNLTRRLRDALDMERPAWPLPALRKVAELLLEVKGHRRRSASHEARWLNLLGFCMRPGFGYPLDDWRVRELWKIWHAGVLHPNDEQCRTEWWILWRRVAGGLTRGQQDQLMQAAATPLTAARAQQSAPKKKAKGKAKAKKGKGGAPAPKVRRLGKQERVEMWMSASSLEHVDAKRKSELGKLALERVLSAGASAQDWWALSRLGARVPFHGPANQVVSRKDVERWIDAVLTRSSAPGGAEEAMTHALAHLARRSGDRERDLSDGARERVVERLRAAGARDTMVALVTEGGELGGEEESHVFGESLPAGLVLAERASEPEAVAD